VIPEPNSALIVVDMQNDFVTGSLAVPDAQQILPFVNDYIDQFGSQHRPVIFTKDFHKADHPSFKEHGGIWPKHCVIGTNGQDFAYGLDRTPAVNYTIILKGYDREAYSGFQGTPLHLYIKYNKIEAVYVCGLATDYCVQATAMDALGQGLKVFLLTNACAGVDPTTTHIAIETMREAGIMLV
jgi:nicotinamidase/pyrazinamidase